MTEVKRERLTPSQHATWTAFIRMTRANGGVPPTAQMLADDLGMDRSSVSHQLRRIMAKGWARRVAGRYAVEVDVPGEVNE